jgi:hypothetical protein
VDVQTPDKTRKIRELNDLLRKTFVGGMIVQTRSIAGLHSDEKEELVRAVMRFDSFDPDNDPWDEHDFGAVKIREHYCYWKIDYYDRSTEMGSPDPSDAYLTKRCLTLMMQSEY